MPALLNTMCHPGNGNVFIGQGQEPQLDLVAVGLPQGYLFQVDHARQRGFKRKALSCIHAFINFLQHQAACLEGGGLRIEWSQASSDQVGVDKPERLGFSRQKVTGKCSFASAVGSCNDDDFLQIPPVFS